MFDNDQVGIFLTDYLSMSFQKCQSVTVDIWFDAN